VPRPLPANELSHAGCVAVFRDPGDLPLLIQWSDEAKDSSSWATSMARCFHRRASSSRSWRSSSVATISANRSHWAASFRHSSA